jgi:carboxylate-amine ligase
MMVRQNKWRACRYGTAAQLVNSYTFEVQSVSQIVRMLIDRLGPTAETLGCVSYLQQVQSIADGPSWADRQEEILEKTNSPEAIVRQLTTQSRMRN